MTDIPEYCSNHMERIAVVEGHIESIKEGVVAINKNLDDLTRGIGLRVEKHGEDIAVIQAQYVKKEDYTKVVGVVEELVGMKKWLLGAVATVILTTLFNVFQMIIRHAYIVSPK